MQHRAVIASGIGEELRNSGLKPAGPVARLDHAIARAQSQVLAAVLLDLHLPDCHGPEAVARFLAQHPEVPVIATAPRESEGEARKSVNLGARFYLLDEEVGRGLIAPLVQHCASAGTQGETQTPRRLLHDLGNLLAAASGASEMLVGRLAATDPLAADTRELHDVITDSVRVYRKFAASWRPHPPA